MMHRNSGFRNIVTHIIAAFVLTLAVASAQAQSKRIPAGTNITVQNTTALSSGTVNTNDTWSGTLVGDVSVNGRVVAPNGSRVRGIVADSESSGRLSKPGMLGLRVTSVNGIPVTTDIYARDGEGHTKSNITKAGGGAAIGAVLGGI